jgi:hypothetical protein
MIHRPSLHNRRSSLDPNQVHLGKLGHTSPEKTMVIQNITNSLMLDFQESFDWDETGTKKQESRLADNIDMFRHSLFE